MLVTIITETTGKGDDGETVGRKRKAAASAESGEKKESSESPQYDRWLMKSEPESRFENGIDMKVRSLISTVCCFGGGKCEWAAALVWCVWFHCAVRDWRSEGFTWSDWLLGWRTQLSGMESQNWCLPEIRHRSEKVFFSPALCKFFFFSSSSLIVNVPLNCQSSAGAQFHEADERRAVGFLLPQQLQRTGNSRDHESMSHSSLLLIIF